MAWRLRFDGTNDYVSLASLCTVNWGTGTYSVEFGAVITAFPVSGNQGIIGSDATTTTGITLRQASGDGALAVLTSGTFRFASVAGLVILNEYHVYRLEHDAGGSFRWYRDGVQIGSTGTYNTTSSASIRAFGRANSSGTPGYASLDLSYVELVGFTNAQTWQADLSSGTGEELLTVSGSNVGTLNNFPATDEEWIFISEGGEQEISLGTLDSTSELYEPSVTKDKLIELPYITETGMVYGPTITQQKLILPPTIPSSATVFEPTVTKGSPSITLGPAFIPSVSVVNEPVLQKDKLIQLYTIVSTEVVNEPSVLMDKWITLDFIGSSGVMFNPEVIGGAIPLPDIQMFTDEGYGLHIRTAREMNDMILALAKRIQILENKDV